MMKVTINKETISSLLFLVCALTFLSIYGGMMAFSFRQDLLSLLT